MANIYAVTITDGDYDPMPPKVWIFTDPSKAQLKYVGICMTLERRGYNYHTAELHLVEEGKELFAHSQVLSSFTPKSLENAWISVQEDFRKKAYNMARRKNPAKFEYLKIERTSWE